MLEHRDMFVNSFSFGKFNHINCDDCEHVEQVWNELGACSLDQDS